MGCMWDGEEMRSKLVAALATGAFVVLATLIALPAQAETKVKQDREGDAPAAIDVTRARYSHGETHVRVTARISALGRVGEAALSISRFEIFEAGYVVRIIKHRGKPARVGLFYFDHFDLEKRACDDVSGTWGRTAIRLKVARECLVGHARPRVFAQFGIQRGQEVDRAPAVPRLARG